MAKPRANTSADVLVDAPAVSLAGLWWRDYHGVLLPYSAQDGPRDTRADLAAGFARTARGALLAAVHIVVRANPQWEPAVFEPTISAQVIGPDAPMLLVSSREAFDTLDHPPAGQGVPVRAYVVLEGFRWQQYSSETASLDLVSAGPGDSDVTVRAVTRIQVRWRGGDWRVIAPPGGTWGGAATAVDSLDGYTRFPSAGS
ncbi:hypothetical protein [Actinomadura roseirufa]|uniref:hypothetical protein n=1 Tax=Actinomadura roseirufa TaxID=2094049 RepID=UPI001040F969|nr:hypothetical protein [Actinomadura roseirufa]